MKKLTATLTLLLLIVATASAAPKYESYLPLDYPTVPKGDGKICGYCVEEAARKVRVRV